ncbi:MAG: hypothetical protein WCA30_18335 [Dermatophilaceae bacterium]
MWLISAASHVDFAAVCGQRGLPAGRGLGAVVFARSPVFVVAVVSSVPPAPASCLVGALSVDPAGTV